MLLTHTDMDYLRIVAWCKDIPAAATQYISPSILSMLLDLGLITQNKALTCYRPTLKGLSLLSSAGFDYPQDTRRHGMDAEFDRRLAMSEILLFFYYTGADVFLTSPTQYNSKLSYLPAFQLRRKRESNVLGHSRFAGLLYSRHMTYVPYFILPENNGIFLHAEEKTFKREYLNNKQPVSVIYTGQPSLTKLVDLVCYTGQPDKLEKSTSFVGAMKKFSPPVCFVPLSEDGARQLRIICIPDYKNIIINAVLKYKYRPPEQSWYDGETSEGIWVVLFDLNLRDIDRIIKQANGKTVYVAVLDFQYEVVEKWLEGKNAYAQAFNTKAIETVLGLPHKLRTPNIKPFVTKEGGFINATDF